MEMFIDLFKESVKRNKDKTAIVADMGSRAVTYDELDLISSKIARALVEKGVQREDIIPVLLPRSIEYEGAPFDPLMVDEPDINADIADRDAGGLGIF